MNDVADGDVPRNTPLGMNDCEMDVSLEVDLNEDTSCISLAEMSLLGTQVILLMSGIRNPQWERLKDERNIRPILNEVPIAIQGHGAQ